jgi:SAM-dependent methyltransferase
VVDSPQTQIIGGSPRRPALLRLDGTQEEFPFYFAFERGERVLDVGCGPGFHLRQLLAQGCDAIGVEVDKGLVNELQEAGLPVVQGIAEQLPFPSESIDGVISSVAIPYTDERRAIGEWARVLKPGGRVRASYHGIGFALDYMFYRGCFLRRLYGTRTLVNTWYYGILGRRMPIMGDSLCQSSRRLQKYYRPLGFKVLAEYFHPGPAGFPLFLYHDLRKG